jgi:cyclohexyl-isocyanide hydratase
MDRSSARGRDDQCRDLRTYGLLATCRTGQHADRSREEDRGHARWITSACTGSLLLGCAGLLRGYRATTHWAFVDLLPLVGAIPADGRVVIDRDRMTSGGVTAGIDIALSIAAEVAGREAAEAIQLQLEYDPAPPFHAGHPRIARPELVAAARARIAARHAQRKAQLARVMPP